MQEQAPTARGGHRAALADRELVDRIGRQRHVVATLILVTIPLALIAILAARTVYAERSAGRAHAFDAARQRALSLERVLRSALERQVAQAEAIAGDALRLAAGGGTDEVSELRRLVADRKLPFATLVRGDRLVFPPEGQIDLLHQERAGLRQVEPALPLALAGARAKGHGIGWSLMAEEPALTASTAPLHAPTTRSPPSTPKPDYGSSSTGSQLMSASARSSTG